MADHGIPASGQLGIENGTAGLSSQKTYPGDPCVLGPAWQPAHEPSRLILDDIGVAGFSAPPIGDG